MQASATEVGLDDEPAAPHPGAHATDPVSAVVLAGGVLVGLLVLALTLHRLWGGVGHGLDLTDEGLYLRSADAPGAAYAYVGLWGAYLHPLFWSSGYDLATYRALGIVLLVGAALVQSYGLRRALAGGLGADPADPGRIRRLERVGLDVAVVGGTLTYYSLFLVTPSYNWLTLVGVLLCGGGVLALLAPARGTRWDLLDPVLMAVGSFLALVSRPTAGVGLWLCGAALVLVASARPLRRRLTDLAVLCGATAVLGALHLLLVTGWSDSLDIVRRTLYYSANDTGAHSLAALLRSSRDQLALVVPGVWHLVGAWPLAGFAVLVSVAAPAADRARLAGLLGAGSVAVVALKLWTDNGFRGGPGTMFTLPFAGIALIATAAAVAASWTVVQLVPGSGQARRPVLARSGRVFACGLYVVVSAALYAFSSNNGLVYQLWGGFGILTFATLLLLAAGLDRRSLPLVAGTMALVSSFAAFVVLGMAVLTPYRTAAVDDATSRVTVSSRGATILVGPAEAAALTSLRSQAVAGGWRAGTPLVDLTPFHPGVGYLLDSRPPTTIMLGFSPAAVRWSLARQDGGAFHDAWVLVAADTPADRLATLDVLGRTFPDDYVRVASVQLPQEPTGLVLWRPRTP